MSPLTDHLDRLDRDVETEYAEYGSEIDPPRLLALTAALRDIDALVVGAEESVQGWIEPADLRRILDRITGGSDE